MAKKEKVRSMTVAYTVESGLYINITNRCTNRCDFCIRNNGDGAYGSESLWLQREPSCEEILEAVFAHDLNSFSEIVFCGYGEPSCRLSEAREVALKIKQKHSDIKIRINTNGQSDLILGFDSAPLYEGAFDTVSISLNAPSPERYNEICHSSFGIEALPAILKFARNVNNYVQNVTFSVVRDFVSKEELEECYNIAKECGVSLRVRDYIS